MASSAKRRKSAPEPGGLLQQGMIAVGNVISRNPAAVGGSTAFLVALLYVSANALWYQPHAHTGPLFATRAFETFISEERRTELAQPQTTIRIERPEEETTPRLSDPVVEKVQQVLFDLKFYEGGVDGIKGPNTRRAVEAYQRKMGLTPTGDIDQDLLEQLGAAVGDETGAIAPNEPTERAAEPKQETDEIAAAIEAAGGGSGEAPGGIQRDAMVARIQMGLRASGNETIEVDGVLGARTKAAIKEFQSAYGLPQTGEPDRAVYAKMKEKKLTD